MSERYYYRIGTVQEGPLSINELCDLARQKVITPDTPINKEFDKIWKEASQFPALQPIFTGLIAEHYAKLKQREQAMREAESRLVAKSQPDMMATLTGAANFQVELLRRLVWRVEIVIGLLGVLVLVVVAVSLGLF